MKIGVELSKYDIIGFASLMGASKEKLEKIEVFINENDTLDFDCIKEEDKGYTELKTLLSAMAIAQIAKTLNLE